MTRILIAAVLTLGAVMGVRAWNAHLIAEGYANEYTYRTPHRYQAELRAAESAAADESRGLWSPETCPA